jgi:glycosidase
MRVNDDYKAWNVEKQIGEEGSVLEFWKRALKVRKNNGDVLVSFYLRNLISATFVLALFLFH